MYRFLTRLVLIEQIAQHIDMMRATTHTLGLGNLRRSSEDRTHAELSPNPGHACQRGMVIGREEESEATQRELPRALLRREIERLSQLFQHIRGTSTGP